MKREPSERASTTEKREIDKKMRMRGERRECNQRKSTKTYIILTNTLPRGVSSAEEPRT